MGDHDGLFKRVFGDPVHAAAELRSVLPAQVVEALDLDALELVPTSFVDPQLAQRHVDLLFTAPRRGSGSAVYVYFLVEHQSEPDPLMPWRVLTYVQRIWESLLRDDPERRSLPPIVPLVVHHGAGGWSAPRRLHEVVDGLREVPTLRRFVPDFELLIDDLARVPDDELRQRPLAPFPRLALWLLRDARDPEELLAHLGAWTCVLREALQGGAAHVNILLRYTSRVAGREPFDRLQQTIIDIAPAEVSSMITAAQSYYEEGREQGRQEGRQEGLREGLAQLLSHRFGPLAPDIRARIDGATPATVQRWFQRALSATSVTDVLDGD